MASYVKTVVTAKAKVIRSFVRVLSEQEKIQQKQPVEIDFNRIVPTPSIYERFNGGVICGFDYVIDVLFDFVIRNESKKRLVDNKTTFEQLKALSDFELIKLVSHYYEKLYEIVLEKSYTYVEQLNDKEFSEQSSESLKKLVKYFCDQRHERYLPPSKQDEYAVLIREQIKLMVACRIKYVISNPLDWKTVHWGTKWNASYDDSFKSQAEKTLRDLEHCKDNDVMSVSFQTAWNTPIQFFIALSKTFPKCPIHIEYADEDFFNTSNCGILEFENGYCFDDKPFDDLNEDEIVDWACELWYGQKYKERYGDKE